MNGRQTPQPISDSWAWQLDAAGIAKRSIPVNFGPFCRDLRGRFGKGSRETGDRSGCSVRGGGTTCRGCEPECFGRGHGEHGPRNGGCP